jgi:hypothetical protein
MAIYSSKTDSFNIRLIRDINTETKATDDVITIIPAFDSDDPTFKVIMETAGCQVEDNTPKFVKMDRMSVNDTYYYIQSLLTLLPLDEDEYTAVQIDMPLMPSVLVRVENVHKILPHVLYHFYFIHDNWPTKTDEHRRIRYRTPLPTHDDAHRVQLAAEHAPSEGARRHLFFDEDGGVSHIKMTLFE